MMEHLSELSFDFGLSIVSLEPIFFSGLFEDVVKLFLGAYPAPLG